MPIIPPFISFKLQSKLLYIQTYFIISLHSFWARSGLEVYKQRDPDQADHSTWSRGSPRLLCAHPNGHIWQAARGLPQIRQNSGKTNPKRYLLLNVFPWACMSGLLPWLFVWRGVVLPREVASHCVAGTSQMEWCGGSVRKLPIALSWSVPERTTVGMPSDHHQSASEYVWKAFHKISKIAPSS